MNKKYYVIVNLNTLEYQKNGEGVILEKADKFETLLQAKEELATYDEDCNLAIYKVEEFTMIHVEKVEKAQTIKNIEHMKQLEKENKKLKGNSISKDTIKEKIEELKERSKLYDRNNYKDIEMINIISNITVTLEKLLNNN